MGFGKTRRLTPPHVPDFQPGKVRNLSGLATMGSPPRLAKMTFYVGGEIEKKHISSQIGSS